jgi:hypothetical protein
MLSLHGFRFPDIVQEKEFQASRFYNRVFTSNSVLVSTFPKKQKSGLMWPWTILLEILFLLTGLQELCVPQESYLKQCIPLQRHEKGLKTFSGLPRKVPTLLRQNCLYRIQWRAGWVERPFLGNGIGLICPVGLCLPA